MIDLFAGCGGMTCGFVAEGFTPTLAVEWDLHAAATYAANHGEGHTLWRDIGTVRASEIPKSDIVIGGPPCQGFSNLGSKDVNDPRNKLWREYLRVVRLADPQVFVIENVDRFMRTPEFDLLLAEADHGSLSRYHLAFGHLNAADFGVAQRRIRTIVIGSRIGPIDLPQPTHARNPATRRLKKWVGTRKPIGRTPADADIEAPAGLHCRILRRAGPRRLQGSRNPPRPYPHCPVAAALRPRAARRRTLRRARPSSSPLLA